MDDDASVFLGYFCFGAFVCGAIGGLIGASRNNVGSGIIWGALLGPIGWILVLFLDNRTKCPACMLPVPDGAQRCGHCGREFYQRGSERRTEPVVETRDETKKKKCLFCAELIQLEAIKCRYCGSDLPPQPLQQKEKLLESEEKPPEPLQQEGKSHENEEKPPHPQPDTNRVIMDMAGVLRVSCPLCGMQILVSTLKPGDNFCPHCFEKFNVE